MSGNKFLSEIHEQPLALQETLDFYQEGEGCDRLSRAIRDWKDRHFDRIIFTGMGSSFFISNTASVILNSYGIQAISVNTGELIHYHFPVITPRTMMVCVSQSGESFEIVKLLEKLAGVIYCIGISNEPESTLARHCHLLLPSKAGKEYMTSTKTFTSSAMVAIMLALALTDKWTSENVSAVRSMIETVGYLIHKHAGWLPDSVNIIEKTDFIQLLGRGPSIAAVQQGALMFMEGARRPASALFSGEFRHGPMELINEKIMAIILAPGGDTYLQHVKLAEDIHRFGGHVIFLSNQSPHSLPNETLHIPVPCADEFFFCIPAIIPLQLMVNEWAVSKGCVPGAFIRGAKVTIIE